jgi:hypothetical protein
LRAWADRRIFGMDALRGKEASMEEYNEFRQFWTPFFALLTLLGFQFLFLAIGLAGWASALRRRQNEFKKD